MKEINCYKDEKKSAIKASPNASLLAVKAGRKEKERNNPVGLRVCVP
jgi:hypothetical protein